MQKLRLASVVIMGLALTAHPAWAIEFGAAQTIPQVSARSVNDSADAKSWGGVAAFGNSAMLTWVEDGHIKYATSASLATSGMPTAEPLPGQIIVDPDDQRWLRRHGGGPVYICGPGEPEDFLYRGQRNPGGTRTGDQVELINRLIHHGGNCIYMQAVRTHGGDAGAETSHNPFLDSDPNQGLDDRILAQWEEWFTLMDRHDIVIYFFFYDDGARIWDTGDRVEAAERAFFEEIVNRFKHHKNLIWLVGEESEERYTTDRVQALAAIIRDADGHRHAIGNHHLSGTTFKAWRHEGALDHFSMQLTSSGEAAHAGAIMALREAAGRYQVIYAESTATPTDVNGRRRFAWDVAMGGAMPMLLMKEVGEGAAETFAHCRILQRFFESTDFTALDPHDEFRDAETKYVLADPGRSYIAYSDALESALGLRGLPEGRCLVTWLDCQNGVTVDEQHQFSATRDRRFPKPPQIGSEAAAWIRFPDIPAQRRGRSGVNPASLSPSQLNQRPLIVDRTLRTQVDNPLYVQLTVSDNDGPGPYAYTIVEGPRHGALTGDNNDRTYSPEAGFVGIDQFTWRVHDGENSSVVATVTIRIAARPAATKAKSP